MADIEREIQNHYNLPTLYPSEWPSEKNLSSDEEDAAPPVQQKTLMVAPRERRKSRFYTLERTATNRISVPGAERGKDGIENLVQKDEPDPLGSYPSVVQVLRQRGLPVEDDMKLRNRFLLSSTSFNPASFLSQVHRDADTETLLQGLDFLSQSIEQKSASLKVLVESNFERFVRAKSTIDNVYANMRDQGTDPETTRRPHSRHASRGGHSRGTSGPFSPVMGLGAPNKVPTNEKKKNALVKESEYGVLGVKAPLLEAAVKAEEVWGPALGGREKEDVLKSILGTMEKHRGLFEVGPSLHDAIKRQDYDTLVEDYLKARKYAEEAKNLVDISASNRTLLSDDNTYRVLVTARMWSDIEDQIAAFKRDVWKKLAGTHFTKQANASEDDRPEEHMALINVLLELGVDDNPIWVWLASRYDFLKNKITTSSERSKVEIEILRRRLANAEKPSAKAIAEHLRSANVLERRGASAKMDSTNVLDFWDYLHESMSTLLSTQGGILGEVIEFWETAKSFIDGKAATRLPPGIDGASKKHHRLSTDGVRDLRAGATELVGLIREHILTFFTEPPIEDISLLFSPMPPTPETPRTPASASLLSPRSATRFKFDPNDIPPPSPRRGEAWEQHAFWPPNGNALSGVHYLSKILALVGTAAVEMANLSIIQTSPESVEQLKTLVGAARENCLRAVCGAWNIDADNCKLLEDWTRIPEKKELTNMPNRFMALQAVLLTNIQKILYIPETVNKPGPEVVVPPSQKLIGNVRGQFMTSLYKTFSGMVENAEKSKIIVNDSADDDIEGITVPARGIIPADMGSGHVDMTDRNVRTLLTLSNLQSIRNDVIPQLISQFETNFTVKLTDEVAQIRDVLGQIDSRLFKFYVNPICKLLSNIVHAGIASPTWGPATARLTDASPFVHNVLLNLVIVHTEVSTTTGSLTTAILKHMLEHVSQCLIDAFRQRDKYDLPKLMQATLDVEFLAQTLASYTTDKASEIQSNIYLVLDERTDNEARQRLQGELPALKSILKRLKDKTKGEFACFKRQRHRGDRPGSG